MLVMIRLFEKVKSSGVVKWLAIDRKKRKKAPHTEKTIACKR